LFVLENVAAVVRHSHLEKKPSERLNGWSENWQSCAQPCPAARHAGRLRDE